MLELMIKGGHLQEFVDILPFGAYIKDVSTGQYIVSNKTNAVFFGCVPDEISGKSFDEFRGIVKCGDDYFDLAEKTDKKACIVDHILPYESKNFIDYKGVTYRSDAYKLAFRRNGKAGLILAMFTHSRPMQNIMELLDINLRYYPSQKAAVYHFLTCYGLSGYFCSQPTVRELKTVILYARHKKISEVAEISGRPYQTVYSCIKSLENRCRDDITHLLNKITSLMVYNNDEIKNVVRTVSNMDNTF